MEKNIILAQIGKTRNYNPVRYKKLDKNNESDPSAYNLSENDKINVEYTESSYSFHVILNEIEKEHSQKADFLVLVGTQESSWANLCKFFGEKYTEEYENLKCMMQEDADGLGGIKNILEIQNKMEEFLTKCLNGTNVRILIQNNGITSAESKENFNLLIGMLSEILDNKKEENVADVINLHLDISNGFRSFPIYVFLSSNYIAQMRPKKESIRIFMYYGMFEKKLKLENGKFISAPDGNYVPYVDMSDASDIMQWTDAVIEFYNNGSVIQLLKILDSNANPGLADMRIDDGQNTLSGIFRKFNYAMNSNNLKLLEETTRVLSKMDQYLDDRLPDYAKNLLNHISNDFRERFHISEENRSKYGMLSIQVANWYLDQQRIGDAVIALQEGMITYVMEIFPTKCESLINKKITTTNEIQPKTLPDDEALFNFEYREIVRKYVFDTREIEEKEWLREYQYLCDHLRDPAMRMHYNITDKSTIETDMDCAVKSIRILTEKMLDRKLDSCIEKCLDELLNTQEHDFFISYRRKFNKSDDGINVAQGISDFLSKQTYTDKKGHIQKYDVFLDLHDLPGTAGEFPPKIRKAIRNSKYVILLLGNGSFDREYSEKDYYYMEIQTATDENYPKDVFVVLMDGFENSSSLETFPDAFRKKIKKIEEEYQHVGNNRKWGFSEQQQNELHEELWKCIWKNQEEKQKMK